LADWKRLYEKWGLLSGEMQEKIVVSMDSKAREKTEEFKKWLLEDVYREKVYFEKVPSDRRFILASPREIGAVAVSSGATVSEVSRVVEISKVSEVSRVVEVSKSVGISPVGVGVMSASVEEVGTLPKVPADSGVTKSSEIPVAVVDVSPTSTKVAADVQTRRRRVVNVPPESIIIDSGVTITSEIPVGVVNVPPTSTKVAADVQTRRRLDNAIRKLETNPTLGMPLCGSLSGKRSLTIGGYRVIYTVDPNEKTILLYAAKRKKKK
jgi:mRNA-degrading endonuclease RelE of RelBE toxin-antitoxin system